MKEFPNRQDFDLIVIGGGLTGLLSATLASLNGAEVLLIEGKADLGGRAVADRMDGYRFNRGPHALYLKGELLTTLRSLGLDPSGCGPSKEIFGLVGAEIVRMPDGPVGLVRTKALGPAGRVGFVRLMSKVLAAKPGALGAVPFAEWLASSSKHQGAIRAVNALVRLSTYSADPGLLSADAALSQLKLGMSGVRYLDGGWQAMVDSIEALATEQGVLFKRGQPVKAVAEQTGGVLVETTKAAYESRSVVVAGLTPKATARLLGVDDWRVGPAAEVAVLDLGLEKKPERGFLLGLDRPVYFSVHQPLMEGTQLDGTQLERTVASAMRYLDGSEAGSTGVKAELVEVAGIAGAQVGESSRFLARMPAASATPLPLLGGLAGRPGVRVDGQERVFVAGDWVGTRGLLADAGAASAELATTEAAQYWSCGRQAKLVPA